MGSSISPSNDQLKKQCKEEILKLNNNIINYIEDSFQKTIFSNTDILNKWKKKIIDYIDLAFIKKNKELEDIISSIKIIKDIEKKKEEEKNEKDKFTFKEKELERLDFFTSKDIQIKNLEITREFEGIFPNFINDEDEVENNTIAFFFQNIANISRMALNESHKFLSFLYEDYYLKNKKKDNIIIFTLDQFKKEFSSWVKNNDIKDIFNIFLNRIDLSFIKKQKNKEMYDYFLKLFKDLLKLYYQSELSFPPIEISFKLEDNIYNSNYMIDILNKGNNKKKVNFVFFPSLYSNGNFLQNGKQWVFTYMNNSKKKTFYFEDIEFIPLVKSKFIVPKLSDKIKIEVKNKTYLIAELNYNISDKVNKEYIFHLKNKKTKKSEKQVNNQGKIILDEYLEFIQCDFFMMGEKILSTK